jgi:hypothetical protein
MSKLKGIDKKDDRSIFIFTKENNFYGPFKRVLMETGFEEWEIPDWFSPDDQHLPDLEKEHDHHLQCTSAKLMIDIILGKDRIFVLAYGENLEKFNELIAKHFSF